MKPTSQMPSSTSLDAEFLAGQHDGDVDLLAVQGRAETAAAGKDHSQVSAK
jgi:hypothetical protein